MISTALLTESSLNKSNGKLSIPNFVNNKTLAIISSYSGNTEETISALKKCSEKKSEICIITSGGQLEKIAKDKCYNHILIPGGNPPRAMFGYSFVQLFYVLNHYEIIGSSFNEKISRSIELLKKETNNIQIKAKEIAKQIFQKTPIIYVGHGFEGVAIRLRQQINENSKMLCWHHVLPEMNHNELLGWKVNTKNTAVLFLRNRCDLKKNQVRIDISKSVISKLSKTVLEVWSKGDSVMENTLYLINFGDWISWYLSELNGVDAVEIEIIDYLKNELKNK